MEECMRKTRNRLEDEFNHLSSEDKWTFELIENMKNVLKSIYYIDVICAMKDGEDYPGSDYMNRSYARGGMSRRSYDNYRDYDDMRGSGRRYYDGEKENAINKMRMMMDSEQNPEVRMAIQNAIRELESK